MEGQVPTGSERYCLRWNNYTNNLLRMISEQHMNEKFVDVVLVCENHYVKVHRLILSACSVFFESLLESQVGQVFQPYIVLTGVKFEHLKYIIEFMYSGEIRALDKDIEEILALGEKLKVKGLCSVVLKEKVSIKPQDPSTNVEKPKIPQSIKPVPFGIGTPIIAKKNPEASSIGRDCVPSPNGSIPEVPSQPPAVPSASTPSAHIRSLPKGSITSALNTPVSSALIDNKQAFSEANTQIISLSTNVKTGSLKQLPKIQVRHPSVINASATVKNACFDGISDAQKDITQASTKSLKDLDVSDLNKQMIETQKSMTNMLDAHTELPQQAVGTPKLSSELGVAGDSSRSSAESSRDVTAIPNVMVMEGQSIIVPKGQKQTPTTPVVHYEAAQSDIVFDIAKKKPIILKKGIKRKISNPNKSEDAATYDSASDSSDSCTNKTLAESKCLPSKPVITEEQKTIKSKIDKVPNKPGNSVADTKTAPTSPTQIIHEEIKLPDNLVAMTSVSSVETSDEAMEVPKEEILEHEASNRNILIRDSMDVMKNGTQVPKKVLEDEHRKPVNPFMLFANEWRGKIAAEHPGESKREISLRISQMWKSLEPDNRRIYYRRARQAVKEESPTAPQSIKRRKSQNEDVTVADLPKNCSDFEIIICGDGENSDE